VYRANDPRLLLRENDGAADQASAAVLNVNCADWITDTALAQAIYVPPSGPQRELITLAEGPEAEVNRFCALKGLV
jgi:hypothetical protein